MFCFAALLSFPIRSAFLSFTYLSKHFASHTPTEYLLAFYSSLPDLSFIYYYFSPMFDSFRSPAASNLDTDLENYSYLAYDTEYSYSLRSLYSLSLPLCFKSKVYFLLLILIDFLDFVGLSVMFLRQEPSFLPLLFLAKLMDSSSSNLELRASLELVDTGMRE